MTNSQQLGPLLIHQMNSCCVREWSEGRVYAQKHVCMITVHFWAFNYGLPRICLCGRLRVWISRSASQT